MRVEELGRLVSVWDLMGALKSIETDGLPIDMDVVVKTHDRLAETARPSVLLTGTGKEVEAVASTYAEEVRRSASLDAIAAERRRQIEKGWDPEHDAWHPDQSLAQAAACYAMPASRRRTCVRAPVPSEWPWEHASWRPGDRKRELVKAGALIVAELERLEAQATEDESNERGG